MSDCSHDCSSCGSDCGSKKQDPKSFIEEQNPYSNVKKVIGIVSGKGGVGKSLVTSLTASALRKMGYKTAILDADITGPSIPKMFGMNEKAGGNDMGIIPAVSKDGTKIMSVNLLLDNADDPVIWRGPVIAGVVKQFWSDVIWDEVDYMLVDMPPGTGDVPLTVFQSLPVDGIVVVTSPQELVEMIVGKAVKMADMMNIPVLGVVENMSYFVCSNCNEKHYIYGNSHVDELAAKFGIDTVSKIPIEPGLAKACDKGAVEEYEHDYLAEIVEKIKNI